MIAFLNRPIRIKNLEIKPDVVIMATGSKLAYPPFEGKAKFLTHYENLAKKLPRGENFLVIGGGSVGCEVAEYLPDKGKKVSVVEILDPVACDAQSDARKLLAQRLKEKGVTIYTRSKGAEGRWGKNHCGQ